MSTIKGSIAESIFIVECLKRDISIYKPIVDNAGIDFISSENLNKIQVKSSFKPEKGCKNMNTYRLNLIRNNSKKYHTHLLDYYALYISTLDLWYIIPTENVKSNVIRVRPSDIYCKYEEFKDRFDLISN